MAEKLSQEKVYVSMYSLKRERKSVCLSDCPMFFGVGVVEQVELLVD